MFALCAAILLCLLSGIRAAPLLSCEDLVRPVDHMDVYQLKGNWALIAGSLNHPASLENLKLRDSITFNFSNLSQTAVSYTQINRFGPDVCQYLSYNVSIENGTIAFDVGGRFNLTGAFLYTSCPDCVVMRWDVESTRRVSLDLYLLSRRRDLGTNEMEEYRAQLECLGLPPPVVMDPSKELCPEQNPIVPPTV